MTNSTKSQRRAAQSIVKLSNGESDWLFKCLFSGVSAKHRTYLVSQEVQRLTESQFHVVLLIVFDEIQAVTSRIVGRLANRVDLPGCAVSTVAEAEFGPTGRETRGNRHSIFLDAYAQHIFDSNSIHPARCACVPRPPPMTG